MLKYTLSSRCKNWGAKYYVTDILHKVHTLFRDKKRKREFLELYEKDYEHKFGINELLKIEGKWNKVPGPQRKFIPVDNYIPVVDEEETMERLKTTKSSI